MNIRRRLGRPPIDCLLTPISLSLPVPNPQSNLGCGHSYLRKQICGTYKSGSLWRPFPIPTLWTFLYLPPLISSSPHRILVMSYYYGSNQYQNDAPENYFSPQDLMSLPPTLTLMSNMPQGPSSHQSGTVSPQDLMSLPPTMTLMSNMPQGPSSRQSSSVSPQQLMSLPPTSTLMSNMPQGASSHQSSSVNISRFYVSLILMLNHL